MGIIRLSNNAKYQNTSIRQVISASIDGSHRWINQRLFRWKIVTINTRSLYTALWWIASLNLQNYSLFSVGNYCTLFFLSYNFVSVGKFFKQNCWKFTHKKKCSNFHIMCYEINIFLNCGSRGQSCWRKCSKNSIAKMQCHFERQYFFVDRRFKPSVLFKFQYFTLLKIILDPSFNCPWPLIFVIILINLISGPVETSFTICNMFHAV